MSCLWPPDLTTGLGVFIDDHDSGPAFGRCRCGGESGRPGTNHQDIARKLTHDW
jgi:hypothetical protein